MSKKIIDDENMQLTEAIYFNALLEDPAQFESSEISVPGSISDCTKRTYSRKEAISAGIDIDFSPKEGCNLPAEAQRRIYENQLLKDRMSINGVIVTEDGIMMTPTQESLRESRRAELSNIAPAVTYYGEIDRGCISPTPKFIQCEHHLQVEPTFSGEQGIRSRQVSLSLPAVAAERSVDISMPSKVADPLQYVERAEGKGQYEAELFKKILRDIPMLNISGVLYCLDTQKGYYVPVTDNDLGRIINARYGDEILRYGHFDKTYSIMYKLLHLESSIYCNDFPKRHWHIWPFQNGLYDIYNRRTYNFPLFHTYRLSCLFDSAATCPTFDRFIQSVACYDPAVIQLLWEVIGYILSPDISAKNFFVFCGVPNSGKSVLANVLTKLLGQSCVSSLSVEDFARPFPLSDLIGKHLNVYMDLPDSRITPEAVGKLKMLTGGDRVTTDIKYRDPISFHNTAKLLFGSNFEIKYSKDAALNQRMVSVPFNYSVPKEKQNPDLLAELLKESSGICNKAIAAYLRLRQNNFKFTTTALSSRDEFILDGQRCRVNTAALTEDAIKSCFYFTQDEGDLLSSEDAYKAYCGFCSAQMIQPETQIKFSKEFRERCVGKKKAQIDGHSVQVFVGVKLK